MDDLLKPLNTKKSLEPGTIIRRIGSGKDQQGLFLEYDGSYNMILCNIIDMKAGTLLASVGVLKPQSSDKLYYYESSFGNNPVSEKAMKIIKNWPLYKKYVDLQDSIVNFIKISYVPEQIIDMSNKDSLQLLFVPVQQKFRIGRFAERRNVDRICKDTFMLWLESLNPGERINYLALIMQKKDHHPRFYSVGTKPHEKIAKMLENEMFNFDPTHGGHIKATGLKNGKRHFSVDAGSKYMGLGVMTQGEVNKMVANALTELYPEFAFTPAEGRGAL